MQYLYLYLTPFFLALSLGVIFIKCIIAFSCKRGLFDKTGGRRKHSGDISRLGGLGIITAFWSAVFLSGSLVFDSLKIGLVVSSVLIFIFGIWDDLKELSWKKQLAFQILIALIMIMSGLTVDYIANPWGGKEFRLDSLSVYGYPVLSSVFIVLWIVGFMNVVNWLDGLDGLAGGVGAIASFTLFALSISDLVNQPPLAILAVALTGALLGFLYFNLPPARIFMGSSGSLFLGFTLAVLAIFSGGKIATVFLVMGFPILDSVWVIYRRMKAGKSPFRGDRSHLHYQLLDVLRWPPRKILLFIYLISSTFGFSALVFKGVGKFLVLSLLFLSVALLISVVSSREVKV